MAESEKQKKIESALTLADFFELDVKLSLFGKVVFHWIYPPKKIM